MKIVKFKNGMYAIRRQAELWFWKEYEYKDLVTRACWWPRQSNHFRDCLGTKERCEEELVMLTDYGTPV